MRGTCTNSRVLVTEAKCIGVSFSFPYATRAGTEFFHLNTVGFFFATANANSLNVKPPFRRLSSLQSAFSTTLNLESGDEFQIFYL